MLSDKDILQIQSKGMTLDEVHAQISRLKHGMSHVHLIAPAIIGKGIERYNKKETQAYIDLYERKQDERSILKFVPASGAATRMFKFLFQFIKEFNPSKENIKDYAERQKDSLILDFLAGLEAFPFYSKVVTKAKALFPDFDTLPEGQKVLKFVETMLDAKGLNYSNLPKGLLPFHKYDDSSVTAFYEHLFESTLYASSHAKTKLHFTVSQDHHSAFTEELKRIIPALEAKTKTHFKVSFSFQKEATETVALSKEGTVFRNEDGSILFRPAGHGALLENLNDLDCDVVFIKNIDNIVVSEKNINVSNYKKLLAGVLLEVQADIFHYLHMLDAENITNSDLKSMVLFLNHRLNVAVTPHFESYATEEKLTYLKNKLNKPIRVCGMVKNEGEPGGGPFWIKDKDGHASLQIVEFAQINFEKEGQQALVEKASHFNPTDLVCGIKDYKGKKFNLKAFVDPEAAFITMKTQNGLDIQALELPGLWNGSMAYWNSIFVEVPVETFNPVKTVNDLLKPAHQVL
ncbi:DUF4301 family protein [Mariniflexile ostreae]|uniref:DUF4301 family protein n=1 Tax=Mariniflexile ostreae TaxID=1520892 RepID=A0ABV5F7H7_9FLAO